MMKDQEQQFTCSTLFMIDINFLQPHKFPFDRL